MTDSPVVRELWLHTPTENSLVLIELCAGGSLNLVVGDQGDVFLDVPTRPETLRVWANGLLKLLDYIEEVSK